MGKEKITAWVGDLKDLQSIKNLEIPQPPNKSKIKEPLPRQGNGSHKIS